MELNLGSLSDCFVDLPSGKRVIAVFPVYRNGVANSGIVKVPIDQYFIKELGETTLSVAGVEGQYTITVTDATNFNIGNTVYLNNPNNFMPSTILNKVGNVLTLDAQLTYSFEIAYTTVRSFTRELNVDGSSSPQTFSILGPGDPGVTLTVTNLIIECWTSSAVDLNKFGNIAGGVTKGLLLKGEPRPALNLKPTISWNVKTNGDLVSLSYDWKPFEATNPTFGQDGFVWQYTWGGPGRHDAAPYLNTGDKLSIVVQDNLQSITKLRALYNGNYEQLMS